MTTPTGRGRAGCSNITDNINRRIACRDGAGRGATEDLLSVANYADRSCLRENNPQRPSVNESVHASLNTLIIQLLSVKTFIHNILRVIQNSSATIIFKHAKIYILLKLYLKLVSYMIDRNTDNQRFLFTRHCKQLKKKEKKQNTQWAKKVSCKLLSISSLSCYIFSRQTATGSTGIFYRPNCLASPVRVAPPLPAPGNLV